MRTKHFELHEGPLASSFLLIAPFPAQTGVRALPAGKVCLEELFPDSSLLSCSVLKCCTGNPPTVVLVSKLKWQVGHFGCPLLIKKDGAW